MKTKRKLTSLIAVFSAALLMFAAGCGSNTETADKATDAAQTATEAEKPKVKNDGDYDKVEYESEDGELTITGLKDKKLTSVTLPKSIVSIGNSAFANCTALTSFVYRGTKAQWDEVKTGADWRKGTGVGIIYCTDGNTRVNPY